MKSAARHVMGSGHLIASGVNWKEQVKELVRGTIYLKVSLGGIVGTLLKCAEELFLTKA
jgi:hypothetical protein